MILGEFSRPPLPAATVEFKSEFLIVTLSDIFAAVLPAEKDTIWTGGNSPGDFGKVGEEGKGIRRYLKRGDGYG